MIDLKEAEWIEFTDSDHRDMRLGVDKLTHLPLRWVVATRDPETRERTEVITSYTQYILQDGVKTPLSIVHSRNDRKMHPDIPDRVQVQRRPRRRSSSPAPTSTARHGSRQEGLQGFQKLEVKSALESLDVLGFLAQSV